MVLKQPSALFFLLLLLMLACTPGTDLCEICERPVHPEVYTTLTLEDGREIHACCPRCALRFIERQNETVRRVEVSDHASGEALAFENAFLVEGSNLTPCLEHHIVTDERRMPLRVCYDRCMPSLIAFRSAEKARVFIMAHGGTMHPPGSLQADALAR